MQTFYGILHCVIKSWKNSKSFFYFVLLIGVSVFGQREGVFIFADLKVSQMARNIYKLYIFRFTSCNMSYITISKISKNLGFMKVKIMHNP